MNTTSISYIALALTISITPASLVSRTPKTKKEEVLLYEHVFKPGNRLTINNQRGKIKVEGWGQDKIQIKIVKKAPAEKLFFITINRFFSDTKIALKTSFDQAKKKTFSPISWFQKSTNFSDVEVDYRIKVPHKTAVCVKSGQGAIQVKDISDSVRVKAEQATITVNNILGNVAIVTQQADIVARMIRETIDIQTVKSDIELNQIGPVNIQLTEGDIIARMITGPLHINAHKSDIIAEQVNQSVVIAIQEGSISLKNIKGAIEVSTQHGDIEVENGENNAVVKTENGSVRFIKNSK